MALSPDPQAGALGSLYSSPGDLVPGTDNLDRTIAQVAELQANSQRTLTQRAAIGVQLTRTVTAVLAVSRPPSRTIPAVLASYNTRDRTVPATLAVRFTRERTVPAVLASRNSRERLIPAALAVSRAEDPALAAPRRGGLMRALLDTLNPLYDTEPYDVAMIALGTPAGTYAGLPWRIEGNLFEIAALPTVVPATPGAVARSSIPGRTDAVYSGLPLPQDLASAQSGAANPGTGLAPFARDLRDYTVGTLASALAAAGYPATAVSQYAGLAATTLIDASGVGGTASGSAITGSTSVLWRVYRAIALSLELAQDDLALLVRQLDLRHASGAWIDWWGELYAVPRLALEADDAYRDRIIWLVSHPRSNGAAIAAMLRFATGLPVVVADGYPVGVSVADYADPSPIDRTFATDEALPGSYFPGYPPRFTVAIPPDADVFWEGRIAELVEMLRPAGVSYTIVRYTSHDRIVGQRAELHV